MSTCDESGCSAGELALAGGQSQQVGWYRYYFADERWDWSPEVEMLHGYEPGTSRPTTELVLKHKHPDDLALVAASLSGIRHSRAPFSTRHRIITVSNDIREVLVIGEQMRDDAGQVIGAQGYYIDVTPDAQVRDAAITEAVSEIADHRAVIEQAKGILRMVYRIDSEAAFGLLKWRSQETNVKLRVLAEQLMNDFTALGGGESLPPRTTFDTLLMTAHQRLGGAPERAG